ncbi:unnamed protein product [Rhizophagus irregularis]|nr:unnamed protein product [Rhizophagus irregularis]
MDYLLEFDDFENLAIWRCSHVTIQYRDPVSRSEIIHELELQREKDLNNNVIRLCGITEKECQPDHLKKYLLVMEYADSPLRNYLKENFKNLTLEHKYKLAYQLANAVSCLHEKGIVHCNLHSGNVLVHQDTPLDYSNLYIECWNDNPDKRPFMNQR